MLLLAAALFVGNLKCRLCHTANADAYAQTPMAQSSRRQTSRLVPQETAPAAILVHVSRRFLTSGDLLCNAGGRTAGHYHR